jgi:hypothetical protein
MCQTPREDSLLLPVLLTACPATGFYNPRVTAWTHSALAPALSVPRIDVSLDSNTGVLPPYQLWLYLLAPDCRLRASWPP